MWSQTEDKNNDFVPHHLVVDAFPAAGVVPWDPGVVLVVVSDYL